MGEDIVNMKLGPINTQRVKAESQVTDVSICDVDVFSDTRTVCPKPRKARQGCLFIPRRDFVLKLNPCPTTP